MEEVATYCQLAKSVAIWTNSKVFSPGLYVIHGRGANFIALRDHHGLKVSFTLVQTFYLRKVLNSIYLHEHDGCHFDILVMIKG
jgi:hypothetical protein